MYREGYETHHPSAFTVRQLGLGNFILVTGEQQREELKKAPETILSFKAATSDVRYPHPPLTGNLKICHRASRQIIHWAPTSFLMIIMLHWS